MAEQNKLEDVPSHTPPNTDPNHSINIPDSGTVDSIAPPTHGSKVDEGEEKRFGFFGFGFGWDLFILGFFLLGIPWLVGAVIFLLMICFNADMQDKYGYLACFIGAVGISLFLDSIERETCTTKCFSQGVDFS
ncbi:uncharacterized protein LOC123895003 [Trifolium pratense]|uniref:uncharacterized protein LOC123895003 n=1 Tax=Trifolium pratense TaxID=57577 RepID=UPI001E693AB3|nr:uncharacterized protein LOC123895003 [Trifolium pratense]